MIPFCVAAACVMAALLMDESGGASEWDWLGAGFSASVGAGLALLAYWTSRWPSGLLKRLSYRLCLVAAGGAVLGVLGESRVLVMTCLGYAAGVCLGTGAGLVKLRSSQQQK